MLVKVNPEGKYVVDLGEWPGSPGRPCRSGCAPAVLSSGVSARGRVLAPARGVGVGVGGLGGGGREVRSHAGRAAHYASTRATMRFADACCWLLAARGTGGAGTDGVLCTRLPAALQTRTLTLAR